MKRIGVREFRDHATKYLAGGEKLEIQRHGKTLGYFVPVKNVPVARPDPIESRRSLERLDEAVRRVLEQSGWTEDELVDFFTEKWQPRRAAGG